MRRRYRHLLLAVMVLLGVAVGTAKQAGAYSFTQFQLPTAGGNPVAITTGLTARCGSLNLAPARSAVSRPPVCLPNSRSRRPVAAPLASRRGLTARCGSPNLPPAK